MYKRQPKAPARTRQKSPAALGCITPLTPRPSRPNSRGCAPGLLHAVEAVAQASTWSHVTDGRFRGGWTTRHYGRPDEGIHALQMEVAMRGYLDEPPVLAEADWPVPFDAARAAPLAETLADIAKAALAFAQAGKA